MCVWEMLCGDEICCKYGCTFFISIVSCTLVWFCSLCLNDNLALKMLTSNCAVSLTIEMNAN